MRKAWILQRMTLMMEQALHERLAEQAGPLVAQAEVWTCECERVSKQVRQDIFDEAHNLLTTNSTAGGEPLSMTRGGRPFRVLVTDEVTYPSTVMVTATQAAHCMSSAGVAL